MNKSMAATPPPKTPTKAAVAAKESKTTFSKSSSVSSQKSVEGTINVCKGISLVLVTPGTPPPKGALCLGEQKADLAGDGEKKLWSVICDGAEHGHGKIPGYGTKDEAFYSHEGQDYGVKKFYWIVLDFDCHLEVSKGGEPPLNRLMIRDSPFYLICGRHENHGVIPGYFNEKKEAVYAYGGKEFKAKEFLWVVADNQVEAFRLLKQNEEIPLGWRLATMHDVTKFQVEARAAITEEWAVCTLNDGKIMGWGKGYEYKVEGGVYADCGFKLVAKYGHGPLSEIGWIWSNNWIGTGSRLTRKEEKQELQELNHRLAGYIDKVRGDSMKIGAKVDASDVKKLYEKQNDDLKKALDDIYKNFFLSNNKLRMAMEALIRENEELKWKLERKDMHLKNSMARVNALEEDIRVLGNDLDREQHRHRETQMKVTELQLLIAKLEKQLKEERARFIGDEEQRGILELRIKELQHENEIQKKKITVEVDEHVEVVIEKGREIESLKAELESLQERYKIELEQSRMEFQKTKEGIIKDFQIKLEVKNDRSEDLDKARGQIEMLIKEITELKKELELLKLKKDQEIIDIVSVHKTHIGAKDDEIKAIVDKLEAQIKQYQQLQEVKIALDMEIAVFRRLIENEEDRLDLSCDISPSKTIRRRRSSSSSSSSSYSSDGEGKDKKKKESWGANKSFDGKGAAAGGVTVQATKATVVSATVSQGAAKKSQTPKK